MIGPSGERSHGKIRKVCRNLQAFLHGKDLPCCVLWGMPLEIFAVNISENSDNEPMRN